MIHKKHCLLPLLLLVGMVACEKPEPGNDPVDSIPIRPGGDSAAVAMPHVLILNEGLWGDNNASLSYLDLATGTLENNWFSNRNGRGLGDLAQDLVVYGSKAYVTVSESGSLEAIDTATGLATRVDLGSRYPRYIAAAGGKLYITCYRPRSVVCIDTASLAIEGTIALGDFNPEGIAAVAGKLLVASSNISNTQGTYIFDNRLYVVDAASLAVDTTLVVGYNPQRVMAVDASHAIVNYIGDYGSNGAGAAIVDLGTLEVRQTGVGLTGMDVADGQIYGYYTQWAADYSGKTTFFVRMDIAAGSSTPILTGEDIDAYAIGVHPVGGDIFVADDGGYTSHGELHCFAPDGTRRWHRDVGMLPSKIVFF